MVKRASNQPKSRTPKHKVRRSTDSDTDVLPGYYGRVCDDPAVKDCSVKDFVPDSDEKRERTAGRQPFVRYRTCIVFFF